MWDWNNERGVKIKARIQAVQEVLIGKGTMECARRQRM